MKRYIFLTLSILVTLITGYLFTKTVDISPKVTADFFFASDSEIFKADLEISENFPTNGEQLVMNIRTDGLEINSPEYTKIIAELTTKIDELDETTSVLSLTAGPESVAQALRSPLWQVVLLDKKLKSSNLIIGMKKGTDEQIVQKLEEILANTNDGFVSGIPYIVNKIGKNLAEDFTTFAKLTIIIFTLAILVIFRSFIIAMGVLLTFITAPMLTLTILAFIGKPVTLLLANLATMVAIITISHIIYLTGNYIRRGNIFTAVKVTLPASFWCMVTTLLGFSSLIFVDAKPLQELGFGGAVGTFVAIVCAYTLYLPYLSLIKPKGETDYNTRAGKIISQFSRRRYAVYAGIIVTIICIAYIPKLDKDPSLLDYFSTSGDLRKGLVEIDATTGSSPLNIVIVRKDDDFLDTNESFEGLKKLTRTLQEHPDVGSALTVSLLMEEVVSRGYNPDTIGWDTIFSVMAQDEYGNIADSFIDFLRSETVLRLRMREGGRTKGRAEVIEEIETIIENSEFKILQTGGAYLLQASLTQDIFDSLIQGIQALFFIFAIIALIVSRSILTTIGIIISVSIIMLVMLGSAAIFNMPLELISAPAVNVCIGIAIDTIIHLTLAARRRGRSIYSRGDWEEAIRTQAKSAIISGIVISLGFLVFSLSTFPPTMRFGTEIVIGTVTTILTALILYPYFIWAVVVKRDRSKN